METGAAEEDCGGAEAARSSDPVRLLRPEADGKTEDHRDWIEARERQLCSLRRDANSQRSATLNSNRRQVFCSTSDQTFFNGHHHVVHGDIQTCKTTPAVFHKKTHRGEKQKNRASQLIKEEQEDLSISQTDPFSFSVCTVPLKSENDDRKLQPSRLCQPDRMETGAAGQDCGGTGPSRSSGAERHVQPETEVKTEDSSGSDDGAGSDFRTDTRERLSGLEPAEKSRIDRLGVDKMSSNFSEWDRKFQKKCFFNQHMRVHSCSGCSRSFQETSNLKLNMVHHGGEKPVCDQRFSWHNQLERHKGEGGQASGLQLKEEEQGADGEGGGGAEPERHLQAEVEVKAEDSSGAETDNSDDWGETGEHRPGLMSLGHDGSVQGVTLDSYLCFDHAHYNNHDLKNYRGSHEEETSVTVQKGIYDAEQLHPAPPLRKEEQEEVCISQDIITTLAFTPGSVKKGNNEEKPEHMQLQGHIKQMETEADGEEPAKNSDPETEVKAEDSCGSNDSVDSDFWTETRERKPTLKSMEGCGEERQASERIVHTCSECGKTFREKHYLTKHMRSHTGEKSFNCSFCSKSFKVKGHLRSHILHHTGEKPFSCSFCSKSFSQKGSLRSHILLHTGEKPYSCSLCSKSFSQKRSLRSHILLHTGEKPYSCSFCSKSFSQKRSLQSHILLHTGEKPYSCSECSKSFRDKRNLKLHMAHHRGEKPFSCSDCDRSFNWSHQVKSHKCVGRPVSGLQQSHTGERPYSCSFCSKSFTRKGNLQSHILLHTGEKPYSCSECSKKFRDKSILKLHMAHHRGEKPFSCSDCDRSFNWSYQVKRHKCVGRPVSGLQQSWTLRKKGGGNKSRSSQELTVTETCRLRLRTHPHEDKS